MNILLRTFSLFFFLMFSTTVVSQNTNKLDNCVAGNCVNGKGELVTTGLASQTTYTGSFKNNQRSGKGTEFIKSALSSDTEKYEGDWQDNRRHGQGVLIQYKNQKMVYKYDGQWRKGKKNGKGKEYSASNTLLYEGEFKDNIRHYTQGCVTGNCETGYGVYINSSGSTYIGQFQDRQKNGQGITYSIDAKTYSLDTWSNGKKSGPTRKYSDTELVYSGDAANEESLINNNGAELGCVLGDCENGFGHYKWENGNEFVGEFENGLQQGEGKNTWSDKSKYVGFFAKGNPNGYGRFYSDDGQLAAEGTFKDAAYINGSSPVKLHEREACIFGNCVNGFGILIKEKNNYDNIMNPDALYAEKYEGMWIDGKRTGYGYITMIENGMSYVGQLQDNDWHGEGVIKLANGTSYQGGFRDGERHGFGTLIMPDGYKYIGQYDSGEKHGPGKEYDGAGTLLYDGHFERDERVEQ